MSDPVDTPAVGMLRGYDQKAHIAYLEVSTCLRAALHAYAILVQDFRREAIVDLRDSAEIADNPEHVWPSRESVQRRARLLRALAAALESEEAQP